jgi:hypothetical protein
VSRLAFAVNRHDVRVGIQAHQVICIGHAEPAKHQPLCLQENLHCSPFLTGMPTRVHAFRGSGTVKLDRVASVFSIR